MGICAKDWEKSWVRASFSDGCTNLSYLVNIRFSLEFRGTVFCCLFVKVVLSLIVCWMRFQAINQSINQWLVLVGFNTRRVARGEV